MKIIVVGASGRMGQMLVSLIEKTNDCEVVAQVSPDFFANSVEDAIYSNIKEVNVSADCIIDFSHHSATKELCEYAIAKKMPIVIATTGQTDEEKEIINNASKEVAVFMSANMSVGIALLAKMVKQAAQVFDDADIEIVESHHNQKLDVPSGTALIFANAVKEAREDSEFVIGRHENGKRKKNEVGIHSLRLGNEVGMHEIFINTGSQTISFKHQAHSRELFADGAIKAARFLVTAQAGFYNMDSIV